MAARAGSGLLRSGFNSLSWRTHQRSAPCCAPRRSVFACVSTVWSSGVLFSPSPVVAQWWRCAATPRCVQAVVADVRGVHAMWGEISGLLAALLRRLGDAEALTDRTSDAIAGGAWRLARSVPQLAHTRLLAAERGCGSCAVCVGLDRRRRHAARRRRPLGALGEPCTAPPEHVARSRAADGRCKCRPCWSLVCCRPC